MNTKFILYLITSIFKYFAYSLAVPLLISLYYQEGFKIYASYLFPMILLIMLSHFSSKDYPEEQEFYIKDAFFVVALTWVLIPFLSALPFVFSNQIPNIIDAFFETVSGYTTTGASILDDVEALSKSMVFWRSFTHFIGGLGVLVFVLAILPKGKNKALYLLKAEVPGPTVGKIAAKVSYNSKILIIIYCVLTVVIAILLWLGGMDFLDAWVHSFGTAGTGGFSSKNLGIAHYNSSYIDWVITTGMILSGINFNLFYLLILGNIKQVFKSEELRYYLMTIVSCILLICWDISSMYTSFWDMLRDASFSVATVITCTGFSIVDFDKWPALSHTIIITLMFIGGCAGSTAGGFKFTRVVLAMKKIFSEFKKIGQPSKIINMKLDGKILEKETTDGVGTYFMIYTFTVIILVLLISPDSNSFLTALTAVATTFNNVGVGLGDVGPGHSFSSFTYFSKIVFSIGMILGRLEILPLLILFLPRTYRKIN
ncbi:MAG: potassium transporter KefA [Fusobacteriales bacterium]|nr:MAG: potassium transporter KefA [Fusobacteriales bacterium]